MTQPTTPPPAPPAMTPAEAALLRLLAGGTVPTPAAAPGNAR